MTKNNDNEAFLALVRAGLWEKVDDIFNHNDNFFEGLDWGDVQKLAEEQSVLGLVTAGIQVTGVTIPLSQKLKFLGLCQLIEQRNEEMNRFVSELVIRLHEVGIKSVLVKGQGLAQCYECPLWRSSGDVDLLLDEENYHMAKQFLLPVVSDAGKEFEYSRHQSLTIGSYTVELHGSQRCGLSSRMDAMIDDIQREVCKNGKTRNWLNGKEPINLPASDEDVILVFTHFLKHFYKGGLGLRQICDWCRLLWMYRETIDLSLLESRLRAMMLMSEWKAFCAFAVERLGMPAEAMPLFNENDNQNHNLCKKAEMIMDFVMMSGNFGHNRDSSYWTKYPYLIRKAISMKRRVGDLVYHARIFPVDSMRFLPRIMYNGLRSAAKGE